MGVWKIFSGVIGCLLFAASPAAARDFEAHQTTIPILYRYAACAYALEVPTAEAQIAKCEGLRGDLQRTADEVLPKFNARDRVRAERGLKIGFQEIDREAALARAQHKTMPPAIINDIRCLGERVMQTEDYQAGVAVDYVGIEEYCVSEHLLSVTFVQSKQELERIELLYRRFAMSGRYLDNSRLGSGIASTSSAANTGSGPRLSGPPPFIRMQGFLLLHRLPADELTK